MSGSKVEHKMVHNKAMTSPWRVVGVRACLAILAVGVIAGVAWGQTPSATEPVPSAGAATSPTAAEPDVPPTTPGTATVASTEEPVSERWTTTKDGEIVANEVYIRSGPSANHYPVMKLQAGNRVTIVGRTGEWYEIYAPDGAESLITETYVDTVDNKTGIVNGDNVRVRAASVLPEWSKDRSKVQVQLSRGAEVVILGTTPDGFLRIKPPTGVTLWVHQDLVAEVGPGGQREVKPMSATLVPGDAQELPPIDRAAMGMADTLTTADELMNATEERRTLKQLDAGVKEEMKKPVLERQYQPWIDRYQPITQQEQDEFARAYAQKRVQQIEYLKEAAESAKRMQHLVEVVQGSRQVMMDERATLPRVVPPVPGGFDAQGEIRVSAAYPPGTTPRRYRLVEPGKPPGKTIGYIEIPPSVTFSPEDYIGRYVGVRASEIRPLRGGSVDIIPIYVVSELVPLQQPTPQTGKEEAKPQ
ncbi:MAG TPA: SH3 domain-containing protein [Phycisphaerae bacterium]|nr:SH3 domain-containing protein [Phycisphaerae bacterium]HNU45821.1 SH3 domain-containing protein [Phycisphaerae bacterium]